MNRTKKIRLQSGFSLVEFLVVVAIVAIFILIFLFLLTPKVDQARDAERKGDLEKIKIAFEDYFNDNLCYPSDDVLENCGGTGFQPYIERIACDPITDEPYKYVPVEGNNCKGYRIFATLQNTADPDIKNFESPYNYGISVGVPLGDFPIPVPTPVSSPASSPDTGPFVYACDASGVCNQFSITNPRLDDCPVTYTQTNCSNACGDTANWCE